MAGGYCCFGSEKEKKMVDRQIHGRKHIAAFFITLGIFVIGILIGLRISDVRVDVLDEENRQQRADLESLQLQYLYLDSQKDRNTSCGALNAALDSNLASLETARAKLENYLEELNREEYLLLKREYLLNEVRYWILARQAREACGTDVVSVLYFYGTEEECEDCGAQAMILTSLKDRFKEKLLVFSLDRDFADNMIQVVKDSYGIKEVPSLVIEDKVNAGLVEMDEVEEEICSQLKDKDICG